MEFKDFKQRLDELSRTLPKQYRDENREGVQALIPYGTGYIQFLFSSSKRNIIVLLSL